MTTHTSKHGHDKASELAARKIGTGGVTAGEADSKQAAGSSAQSRLRAIELALELHRGKALSAAEIVREAVVFGAYTHDGTVTQAKESETSKTSMPPG